jgi:hypothetical protein
MNTDTLTRLIDAIEAGDGDLVQSLAKGLPKEVMQEDVLPKVSIPAREWFWRCITSEEQFLHLIDMMTTGVTQMAGKAGFLMGRDFSLAQEDDLRVLLVTEAVNEWLIEQLPECRYATLQIALRLVGDPDDAG